MQVLWLQKLNHKWLLSSSVIFLPEAHFFLHTLHNSSSWKVEGKRGKELNNYDIRGSRLNPAAGVEHSEEWDLGAKFHSNINRTAVTSLVNVFTPSYFFLCYRHSPKFSRSLLAIWIHWHLTWGVLSRCITLISWYVLLHL